MKHEIIIPVMGANMSKAELLSWLKKKGDKVEKGESLFVMETEKATFDVEAEVSGVLKEILVEGGTEVPILKVVGIIEF